LVCFVIFNLAFYLKVFDSIDSRGAHKSEDNPRAYEFEQNVEQ